MRKAKQKTMKLIKKNFSLLLETKNSEKIIFESLTGKQLLTSES